MTSHALTWKGGQRPAIYRRNVTPSSPDAWSTLVSQVGATLLSLPARWRLITVARPALLGERIAQLSDQQATTSDPRVREHLRAEMLHLRDLASTGLTTIDHYLVIWTDDAALRRALPARLQLAWGGVVELPDLPELLRGPFSAPAQPRHAQPHAVANAAATEAWSGLLAAQVHGRVLPTLFRPVLSQPFPVMVIWEVHTATASESRTRLETARHRLEAHQALLRQHSEDAVQRYVTGTQPLSLCRTAICFTRSSWRCSLAV